jgi:hypothetical protein
MVLQNLITDDLVEQTTFKLQYRQEFSRQGDGRTIAKDIGPPIWTATFTTRPLPLNEVLALEAKLNSLQGSMGEFEAYDVRLLGQSSSRTITAQSPSSFTLDDATGLNVGEYLSVPYASGFVGFHQIVGIATNVVSVVPAIRPGNGTVANTFKPKVVMTLEPDSIETTQTSPLFSRVSWEGRQVI